MRVLGRREAHTVAAIELRSIHRLVGLAHKVFEARAVSRDGNTDARGDGNGLFAHACMRVRKRETQSLRCFQPLHQRGAGQRDNELLAAVATGQIARPLHGLAQHLRDMSQHCVACVVAPAIVDLLEVVEVEDKQCKRLPAFLAALQRGAALGHDGTAIEQAGEAIGARGAPQIHHQPLGDELQQRNLILANTGNDLTNLLTSVNIPLLMLSSDLRIRQFTPPMQKLLSVRATDIGRPISDIRLHLSVDNLVFLSDIDENVDYGPIFTAGKGYLASLIAVAGVLFGNGLCYLASRKLYSFAKGSERRTLALFCFLLCLMNVGNFISYVPVRTFTTHADMFTAERGLSISPWWIAVLLGVPFAIATWHFFARVLPDARRYLFPDQWISQIVLTVLSCFAIFDFFGAAGLHGYGTASH